jgi:hypothetical protein
MRRPARDRPDRGPHGSGFAPRTCSVATDLFETSLAPARARYVSMMNAPPGPPAYPSPNATPLTPAAAFDKKVRLLGTVALVLAILKLLFFGYRILRSLATLIGLDTEPTRGLSRSLALGLAAYRTTTAIGDAVRAIPFIAVGVLLIFIALRLQRGDVSALSSLRKWFFWSLGAVGISTCIQVFVIIPTTLQWEIKAVGAIPSLPFFDVKGMATAIVAATLVFALLFGTFLRLVIPVVLYVWAGRLLAEQKNVAFPATRP